MEIYNYFFKFLAIVILLKTLKILRKLKNLNYEGNEIEYLPGCMLKMKRLKNINVKKNYLHPLIWRKLVVNQIPVIVILLLLIQSVITLFDILFQF